MSKVNIMDEKLNTDNGKEGMTGKHDLSESSNDLNKSYNNPPEVVREYHKILEQWEQKQSVLESMGVIIICILLLLSVFFNIYLVENKKYELNILKIEQDRIAREKQEETDRVKLQIAQKNKESADLVIFNDKYLSIRTDYYSKVRAISVKAESKLTSLEDIIKITEERIRLSKDYKNTLNSISIPVQMADFQRYETEFADSDIRLWGIVNAYYSLNDFSKFDTGKVYEESAKSHELFLKAQEEIKNVYTEYGLSYFLKDILINY